MKIIYSIGIRLYGFAISIAALFNEKARKWKQGRKDIFTNLRNALQNNNAPVVWFHCASLGEFEQGRPVIESFRQKFPAYKIVLTFFSPSGYEASKSYAAADYIFYLPLDTYYNARRFVEIVNPKLAVFVKYEFWYNYLQQLHTKNVPVYLISATFRADQYFFKSYGSWFKKQLHGYRNIFVQNTASEKVLKDSGITNVSLAGDSRFDRVIAIAENAKANELVEAFKGNCKMLICGSTWDEDEKVLLAAYNKLSGEKIKLLLVPHEVGERHVKQITEQFGAVTYSSANKNDAANADVMVVDKVGLLSSLYRYGNVAYIGGGFGKDGVHNLPEAAVFGIPVVFGPVHHKYLEAADLINAGGGFSIASADELQTQLQKLFTDDTYCHKCGEAAKAYIYGGSGATGKIISELAESCK